MTVSQNDLRYFIETCKTLNISQAAQNLHVSQPSITLAIQRLEHEMGTAIFVRSKRGVKLTNAGKTFFAHASELMRLWQNIKSSAHANITDIQGRYDFGTHASMALNVMTRTLAPLMIDNPKLEIRLHHGRSSNIVDDIINMRLDMGLAVNPINHPDLIISSILKGEVTFWTSAAHKNDTQNPAHESGTIVFDQNMMRSQALLNDYKENGIEFSRSITSTDLEVIADLVGNGLGVGILPENVARRSKHELVKCENAPVYYDDHCFVYRKENIKNSSIQTIHDNLKKLTDLY